MRLPLFLIACVLAASGIGCEHVEMAGKGVLTLVGPPPKAVHTLTQPARDDARLAVLWIGHATLLVQIDDRFVLTDPVFTSTIAQVAKRTIEPGLRPENLPTVDVVLISHMHADHLSYGSLERIEPHVRHALVPQGGLVYMPNFRFDASELPTWHSWKDGDLVVTAVPVRHVGWRYGADIAWMKHAFTGYVVHYHGLTVYFGGDTAYDANDFEDTARAFPSIDLALLPIAPIHPRSQMGPVHEDPCEALEAFADLGARVMVPIHFDTFPSGLDREGDAVLALRAAAKDRGLDERQVQILAIGEQRVIVGTHGDK